MLSWDHELTIWMIKLIIIFYFTASFCFSQFCTWYLPSVTWLKKIIVTFDLSFFIFTFHRGDKIYSLFIHYLFINTRFLASLPFLSSLITGPIITFRLPNLPVSLLLISLLKDAQWIQISMNMVYDNISFLDQWGNNAFVSKLLQMQPQTHFPEYV